ncbi:conjugal transfer protein [Streptococcus oralis subsp. oralis]|uniref:conjugal transfer protein n=1 Tax=Streptococcus oralis TaxID=1303 RepID=UPI0015E5D25D|nr:conjugal transfer protein [Streptococcus oralis]MBA1351643.1 conjugal transfer protein [Streptococcus oralis subsp. oralis]
MRNFELKKPRKEKQKQVKMKKVSQKRSNQIFLFGLAFFLFLCGLTMFISIKSAVKVNERLSNTAVVETKKETDRKLEQFLDGYVARYFTYNSQAGSSDDDVSKLNNYYGSVPDVKNQGQLKQEMSVVSARMLTAKDSIAVYRVIYDTKKDDKSQRVGIEFSIPYGEKDGKYYVAGLPWFSPVSDFKADGVDKDSMVSLIAKDDLEEGKRKKLISFLELFFKNYTTSQANLDLISKDIKSIGGASFKSLDYSYFKEKDGKILAYVQVTFEVAGTTHSENFSFELREDKDSFFVEKMDHTIPLDYNKKDDEGE